MVSGLYGGNDSRLSSKAGAMEFAIMMNTASDERGRAVVNYREAKRLFDFICRNVRLPDVGRDFSDSLSESYFAYDSETMLSQVFRRKGE